MIRELDHVAILVRSTEQALTHFSDRLGLPVVSSECLVSPPARLTYLFAGNAYVQLVEPLSRDSEIAAYLLEHGEGVHHLCFGSDDPVGDATALGDGDVAYAGTGRGRVSAFVPGGTVHGVRLECTAFGGREDLLSSTDAFAV